VKHTLQPPYDGPFQLSDKYYTLHGHYGHQEVVSLDRLKPPYIDKIAIPDNSPASPTSYQPPPSPLPNDPSILKMTGSSGSPLFADYRLFT